MERDLLICHTPNLGEWDLILPPGGKKGVISSNSFLFQSIREYEHTSIIFIAGAKKIQSSYA